MTADRQFHTQSGMVLLLCLIFLTALTLLVLSASADTVLQNQLSANLQEAERARQSALAAQSWAEKWLLGLTGSAPVTCVESCEGLILHGKGTLPPFPEHQNLSWWRQHGHEAGLDPVSGARLTTLGTDSIHAPLWIVEAIHEVPPNADVESDLQAWYRILVRGSGRSATSVSVIESVIGRSWTSSNMVEEAVASGPCPGTSPEAECRRVSWRELR